MWCVDPIAPDTGGIHPDKGWPLYQPRDYSNFHFAHQDCRQWFKEHGDSDFDYVLHLAAMVGGRAMICPAAKKLTIEQTSAEPCARFHFTRVDCFA